MSRAFQARRQCLMFFSRWIASAMAFHVGQALQAAALDQAGMSPSRCSSARRAMSDVAPA
jgi:hypothetical protein